MKKKMLALCLSLVLCVSLFPTALADGAENEDGQPHTATEFTDVPAGSWFEQGVKTCAEKGIMVGTGEGVFSPDKVLTRAECLTLAVRLYDLQHGGDGTLLEAPEDWGKITLTFADGTSLEGYSAPDDTFRFWSWPKNGNWGVHAKLPGETEEERHAWGEAREGAATLTADGVTYSGNVHLFIPTAEYVLMFQPQWEADADYAALEAALRRSVGSWRPGPDKWYQDVVYTIEERGLGEWFDASLFDDLEACRRFFAQALADAAGELETINEVESFPDLEQLSAGEQQTVLGLYRAGVLTGVDDQGTFGADATLTRAQAAVMVARVLEPEQRVKTPVKTADGAVAVEPFSVEKYDSYDDAVTQLRSGMGHSNEQTFETDDCTIFVYDRGGFMNAPHGMITVIYKAGSALGQGTSITLPYTPRQILSVCTPADTMALSDDRKTFTYTYYLVDTLTYEGQVLREPGVYIYTVELETGTVTQRVEAINFENSFHTLCNAYGYRLENVKDANGPAVALLRSRPCKHEGEELRDYELYLIYKQGQPVVRRLLLPSTIVLKNGYAPTTQEPETLEFDSDGTTLTYIYRFQEPLWNGDTLLHDKGVYIYTGEQSVKLEDAYTYALAEVLNQEYFHVDQRIETENCTIITGMRKVAAHDRAFLVLIYKDGSLPGAGSKVWLPTRGGPSLYNSVLPHSLSVDESGTILTYTYHFDETLHNWEGRVSQKAGDYVYTVDLVTGTVNEEFTPQE